MCVLYREVRSLLHVPVCVYTDKQFNICGTSLTLTGVNSISVEGTRLSMSVIRQTDYGNKRMGSKDV